MEAFERNKARCNIAPFGVCTGCRVNGRDYWKTKAFLMEGDGYPSKAETIQDPAKGPEDANGEPGIVNEKGRSCSPQHEHDVELAHPAMEELETSKDPGQQTGNP